MRYILYYLACISIVSALVTIYDKIAAKCGARRTPENTLLLLCALGGSAAMLITMLLIRHKTRHRKFMIGIPLILLAQTALTVWLMMRQ